MLANTDSNIKDFPKFSWWTVAYELFCIFSVAVIVGLDAVHKYHVAVLTHFLLSFSLETV